LSCCLKGEESVDEDGVTILNTSANDVNNVMFDDLLTIIPSLHLKQCSQNSSNDDDCNGFNH